MIVTGWLTRANDSRRARNGNVGSTPALTQRTEERDVATGALARQDGHADPVAPFTPPPDLAARAAHENFSVAPRLLPRRVA